MSIGPSGITSSLAGSPQSQSSGTDVVQRQQKASNCARDLHVDRKAESASGIGETEPDESTSDRDADGRRLWESTPPADGQSADLADQDHSPSRGTADEKGQHLDLNG